MMDEGRNEEFEAEVVEAEANEMEQTEPALVLGDDDPRDAGLHERILSEEQAWKGKFLDVRSAQVELPNGRIAGRDLVRHPGASAVVALTSSGKIVLVRQYRTAIDRVTVEIPAGKLDPGEDPIECAKRELLEETGFKASRIQYLTTIATTPGFCDEVIHIYMATGLTFAGAHPDDDEFVNVDLVPLAELIDAVLDGKDRGRKDRRGRARLRRDLASAVAGRRRGRVFTPGLVLVPAESPRRKNPPPPPALTCSARLRRGGERPWDGRVC